VVPPRLELSRPECGIVVGISPPDVRFAGSALPYRELTLGGKPRRPMH
jgi:hypothetical protein